jgi:penicillin-binding protein 1C
MQLARLLAGRPKGALSKFLEIRDALRIELSTSKRDVLEMYLNLAPLGVGLTGVERASWAYFGHSAKQTTAEESLMLAGLLYAFTGSGAGMELSSC